MKPDLCSSCGAQVAKPQVMVAIAIAIVFVALASGCSTKSRTRWCSLQAGDQRFGLSGIGTAYGRAEDASRDELAQRAKVDACRNMATKSPPVLRTQTECKAWSSDGDGFITLDHMRPICTDARSARRQLRWLRAWLPKRRTSWNETTVRRAEEALVWLKRIDDELESYARTCLATSARDRFTFGDVQCQVTERETPPRFDFSPH